MRGRNKLSIYQLFCSASQTSVASTKGGTFLDISSGSAICQCYGRLTFLFWFSTNFFRTTSLRYWFIFGFGLSFPFGGSLRYDCRGMWLPRIMSFKDFAYREQYYLSTSWYTSHSRMILLSEIVIDFVIYRLSWTVASDMGAKSSPGSNNAGQEKMSTTAIMCRQTDANEREKATMVFWKTTLTIEKAKNPP